MGKIIFIYISMAFCNFIYSQSRETCDFSAKYEFNWLKDSTLMQYNTDLYDLKICKNQTYFFNSAWEYNDSIYSVSGYNLRNTSDQQQFEKWQKDWNQGRFSNLIKYPKSHLIYYADFRKNSYVRYRDILVPMYYSFNVELPIWEISNLKDTINGIEVLKALTIYGGRRYIAWFAPSIPISEGPYVFRKLPGLIVKIYDDEKNFVFILTDYNNKSINCYLRDDIDGPFKEVSYNEWVKVRTENYFNPSTKYQSTKDAKEQYRKTVLRRDRYLLLEK